MKTLRTWVLLGVLLIAVLVAAVYQATREMAPDDEWLPALDTHSTAPAGGGGLMLWLRELGFRVDTIADRPWQAPEEGAVLLILAPNESFSPDQIDALGGWLERGGTLILAPSSSAQNPIAGVTGRAGDDLLRGLDVERRNRTFKGTAEIVQPLPRPPVRSLEFESTSVIAQREADAGGRPSAFAAALPLVPVVTGDGRTLVGVVPVGRGRAWVIADGAWLSNGAIGRTDHGRLLLNMLPPAADGGGSRGATVWFDEWHHGYHAHDASFDDQLFASSWGRAL